MKSWPTNKTLHTKTQFYDISGGDSECKYEGKGKMKMCNSDRQRQNSFLKMDDWAMNMFALNVTVYNTKIKSFAIT